MNKKRNKRSEYNSNNYQYNKRNIRINNIVDDKNSKIVISNNCKESLVNVKPKRKVQYLKIKIVFIFFLFLCSTISINSFYHGRLNEQKEENQEHINEIKSSYNKYVSANFNINLYKLDNNEYVKAGFISKDMDLELEEINIDDYDKEYFKLKNLEYYVKYTDISIIDKLVERDQKYENYIIYNENIVTREGTKLYVDQGSYYSINDSISLPIIIKDTDKYYVEYDNKLVYVYNDDISQIIESNNTNEEKTNAIAIINYHYVISEETGENLECIQGICITNTLFDSHMSYIKDNGFYTASMEDLEMFIDGKIQLPKKTVVITIDDGWYVARSITILEKYNLFATLFLIGHLASPNDYLSDNLEIASHTWDLHDVGVCPGGQGSPLKCLDEETILSDLKKSRDSLNNTTYFCWPFYEYNDYAINLVKEAGFTMALAGGRKKVTVGTNKYKVPRYGITNTTTVEEIAIIIN